MQVGKFNTFEVVSIGNGSIHLIADDQQTVEVPISAADTAAIESVSAGQTLSLFVRTDELGKPLITFGTPHITLGKTALLKVVATRDTGSWLDWGLEGDLFMPRSECRFTVKPGDSILVYLYRDSKTDRLVATTRLHRHLAEAAADLRPDQAVELVIASQTEMGYKAVVDQRYLGLLYADEVFRPLAVGDIVPGFIKSIRLDGKIDLTLQARPTDLRDELSQKIMQHLKESGGRSELTDKSAPEAIYQHYQVSKKNYKKALGALYRQRLIRVSDTEITLISD
ncbi:MAG: GntR family transcriptional regulator [Granulosicoccus sp.]|nr:GntR family transcriptional regulator [Granulosicoccus sp.]